MNEKSPKNSYEPPLKELRYYFCTYDEQSVFLLKRKALAKTLGLLQPLFKLSELHQCDQGMLSSRFSWKSIEVLLQLTIISEDLFGYIPGISTTPM